MPCPTDQFATDMRCVAAFWTSRHLCKYVHKGYYTIIKVKNLKTLQKLGICPKQTFFIPWLLYRFIPALHWIFPAFADKIKKRKFFFPHLPLSSPIYHSTSERMCPLWGKIFSSPALPWHRSVLSPLSCSAFPTWVIRSLPHSRPAKMSRRCRVPTPKFLPNSSPSSTNTTCANIRESLRSNCPTRTNRKRCSTSTWPLCRPMTAVSCRWELGCATTNSWCS